MVRGDEEVYSNFLFGVTLFAQTIRTLNYMILHNQFGEGETPRHDLTEAADKEIAEVVFHPRVVERLERLLGITMVDFVRLCNDALNDTRQNRMVSEDTVKYLEIISAKADVEYKKIK